MSFRRTKLIYLRSCQSLDSHLGPCPTIQTSPVLWSVNTGADATALCLRQRTCLLATKDGTVIELDLDGQLQRIQRLPIAVGTFLQDGHHMYAWCPAKHGFEKSKGALFDITKEEPHLIFQLENLGEWLLFAAMNQGVLYVGDDRGNLFAIGCDGEVIWEREGVEPFGKVLLADSSGLYFGHRKKLCKYALSDGSLIWEYRCSGRATSVQTAIQYKEHIYFEAGGKVEQIDKDSGELVKEFVPARHRASGICVGNRILVTGSCPTVLFNLTTAQEMYRMNFCGRLSDASMKLHPSGKLLAAWDKLYCIDLSEEGITSALEGHSIPTREVDFGSQVAPLQSAQFIRVVDVEDGIVLSCEQRGDKVVVVPTTGTFNSGWSVRFPLGLKIPGKKYIVDDLVSCEDHKFYKSVGEIRELRSEEGKILEARSSGSASVDSKRKEGDKEGEQKRKDGEKEGEQKRKEGEEEGEQKRKDGEKEGEQKRKESDDEKEGEQKMKERDDEKEESDLEMKESNIKMKESELNMNHVNIDGTQEQISMDTAQ